jgi:hypothetical protein
MSAEKHESVVLSLPADPRTVTVLRVLRPEFRVPRFVPPPGHFLALPPCQVPICPRENASKSLC